MPDAARGLGGGFFVLLPLLALAAASLVLAPSATAAISGGAGSHVGASDGIEIRSVQWRQSGPQLALAVGLAEAPPRRRLARTPDIAPDSGLGYVCVRMHRGGVPAHLCAGTRRGRSLALYSSRQAGERFSSPRLIREARVRTRGRTVKLALEVGALPGGPRPARIAAHSAWTRGACAPERPDPDPPDEPEQPENGEEPDDGEAPENGGGEEDGAGTEEAGQSSRRDAERGAQGEGASDRARERACRGRSPRQGTIVLRATRPRVIGCTRPGRRVVAHGPRSARKVALTFDDGPTGYTSQILRILGRHGARATFYVVGSLARSDPGLLRSIHARGHELGNHSLGHERFPGAWSMRATNEAIRSATGFTPCTFRPPYGLLNGSVIGAAWGLGMSSVRWDVDTADYTLPGSGTIAARALSAGRGSIVLMHDGGGNRSQTVAALPSIIAGLRSRGLELVTVEELLGSRPRWHP